MLTKCYRCLNNLQHLYAQKDGFVFSFSYLFCSMKSKDIQLKLIFIYNRKRAKKAQPNRATKLRLIHFFRCFATIKYQNLEIVDIERTFFSRELLYEVSSKSRSIWSKLYAINFYIKFLLWTRFRYKALKKNNSIMPYKVLLLIKTLVQGGSENDDLCNPSLV